MTEIPDAPPTSLLGEQPTTEAPAVATDSRVCPKVAWPSLALAGLGAAALVAGVRLHDPTISAIGGSLIAASGLAGGLGWLAPPAGLKLKSTTETPLTVGPGA